MQYVVVVTGAGSADGLVAGSLGDAVLTIPRSAVPKSTIAEVQRLDPTRLVILGGHDVVSADAAADLTASTTASVTRFAGQDRYATAARAAMSTFAPPVRKVLIATSEVSPDVARASGPAAGGIPVLLVTRDSVPSTTARALRRLQPASLTIVGGAGAVSDAVVRQLQGHTTSQATRLPAV